jgi:hypothetical protein
MPSCRWWVSVLIVWGFGQARMQPVQIWSPPVGMRHLACLLTWLAFVLLAAAYVPGNAIKARLHHPMVLGVKTWALAHLLANGNAAPYAAVRRVPGLGRGGFRAARRRDRAAGTSPTSPAAPAHGGHAGGGRTRLGGVRDVAARLVDRGPRPG